MSKASLGAGNVPITLDGEDVVLRPTLKAAQTISRQADGQFGHFRNGQTTILCGNSGKC